MRLSVFLLLLVSGVFIIMSVSIFFIIDDLVKNEKNTKQETISAIASDFSALLSSNLNERISDIQVLSSPNSPLLNPQLTISEKKDYLLLFKENYPSYDSLSVYDKYGTKLYDTRNLGIGNNIAESVIFTHTRDNLFYYDRTPIIVDDLEKTALSNILPIIRFSSSLITDEGEFEGLVIANYNVVSLFNNLLKMSDTSFEYALITDKNSIIVKSLNYEILDDSIISHHFTSDSVTVDDDWIIAISYLPDFQRYVDQDELLVVVKINSNVAFNKIHENQFYLQLTAATVAGVLLFIVLLAMRKLSKELLYIDSILNNITIGKTLRKKKLLFDEMRGLESEVLSTEKVLNEEKSSNQEKLDMFEQTNDIIQLVASGDLSKKLPPNNSDSEDIALLKLNINSSIEKLKKLEDDKQSFAAMITHELKTPLVPIKGFIQMLSNEKLGKLTDDQKDAVGEIHKSSEVLYNLIENILLAQRSNVKKRPLNLTTINSSKILNSAFAKLSTAMKDKNIEFKKIPHSNVSFIGDFDLLIEVFTNLIQNAIDFVPAKFGKITISCKENDNNILFSITDNGIGIPKEKQNDIFSKFYQVDSSATRKHGGSGLGLAICKDLIESMGGQIWFTSQVNRGTTFNFTLPLAN